MKHLHIFLLLLLSAPFLVAQQNKELILDGHQAVVLGASIQQPGDFEVNFSASLDPGIDEKDRVVAGLSQEIHFKDGKLTFSVDGKVIIQGKTKILPDVWHRYGLRRSHGMLMLSLDGKNNASSTVRWSGTTDWHLIGQMPMQHGGFAGCMDDVQFEHEDKSIAYFKFNERNGLWARDFLGRQPDAKLPSVNSRQPASEGNTFKDETGMIPVAESHSLTAKGKTVTDLDVSSWISDPDGILDWKDIEIISPPTFGQLVSNRSDSVFIHLKFEKKPNDLRVKFAGLKYNKAFAYTFTFDDGLASAYEYVFPYLQGGKDIKGNVYPGKFYTDGCGNNVAFHGDIAINAVNRLYTDLHIDTPGHLTWQNLLTMNQANWGVLNHGYAHGELVEDVGYTGSLLRNQHHVLAVTTALGQPIDMKHQVLPSGIREFIEPGFETGIRSVHNEGGEDFMGGPDGWRVNGKLKLDNLKLKRVYRNEHYSAETIHQEIDAISKKSVDNGKFWLNDFTHGVEPGGAPGGMDFAVFTAYMDYLESQYGKNGDDRIWVAGIQEIYEYLFSRKKCQITYKQKGNDLFIAIDMNDLPHDLQFYGLTVTIDQTPEKVSLVSIKGAKEHTFQGDTPTKILNFQLDRTNTDEITRYQKTHGSGTADRFTYRVRDKDGNVSEEATVELKGLPSFSH